MSTLLDLHDALGLPPAPTPPADHDGTDDHHDHDHGDHHGGAGFVDCRGLLHRWAEEDD